MDVGRLTCEDSAYERFTERFGTPEQLAAGYLDQCELRDPADRLFRPQQTAFGSRLPAARRRQQTAVAILLLAAMSGGVCYAVLREPPKLSPFTEVQFKGEQVIVTYDGKACEWLELDGLKVKDIVASAKKQFGDRWQKRVSEDLVEVLWGMDHKPAQTVKLRLLDLKTKRHFAVEKARLTEENRRAVYAKRRQDERKLATRKPRDPALPEPPKLSPFTDVRFKGEQVTVTYDDKTCQWLELDGLKVKDIIDSAKKQFEDRWQKRVSEDLVEVLWGMNHKPGNTVKLRLLDLTTQRYFVVENAPLTKENRRAVYAKRLKRLLQVPVNPPGK